jgi:hypothetical protein
MLVQFLGFDNEIVELWVEFWRTSRDVQVLQKIMAREYIQTLVYCGSTHLLCTTWRRGDMAMYTGLITPAGNIDPECAYGNGRRIQIMFLEHNFEIIEVSINNL